MHPKRYEFSWSAVCTGGIAVALVLGVLILHGNAASFPKPGGAMPAAPKKDDTSSQVYEHTFDEVFQASREAMERMGMFADGKDKDKGTISGHGNYTVNGGTGWAELTFDLHVEALNTETRLTVNTKGKGTWGGHWAKEFNVKFLGEVQRVLSMYH